MVRAEGGKQQGALQRRLPHRVQSTFLGMIALIAHNNPQVGIKIIPFCRWEKKVQRGEVICLGSQS